MRFISAGGLFLLLFMGRSSTSRDTSAYDREYGFPIYMYIVLPIRSCIE